MTTLNTRELKPGMILREDTINHKTGALLLKNGTVLNKRKIEIINKLGIDGVKVLVDEEPVIIENNHIIEKHMDLVHSTKKIFDGVKIGKKIILTEINSEVDSIIEEITHRNNVLAQIRQLKEEDDYTYNHSIHVSMLATMMGKWLNFSEVEIKQLALAGLFHDIGKLKIPPQIIDKPGKLTEREFEIIKKHAVFGYNILRNTVGIAQSICLGALQHHEREDSHGYPLGVNSSKIHIFAKIIAVCDIFDAMTSERVYKKKQSPFKVAEQIASDSFGALDPSISLVFLKNISKFYVGNIVQLNNNKMGEIVYVHNEMPTRPVIKTDEGFIDLLKKRNLEIIDVID